LSKDLKRLSNGISPGYSKVFARANLVTVEKSPDIAMAHQLNFPSGFERSLAEFIVIAKQASLPYPS
jgi:hypothetical protein